MCSIAENNQYFGSKLNDPIEKPAYYNSYDVVDAYLFSDHWI